MFHVGDRVRKTDLEDDREGVVTEIKDHRAKVLFDQPPRDGTARLHASWIELAHLKHADRMA